MSLINDISTITTIPVSNLNNIFEKESLCILHKVSENEKKNEPVTYVDLGFGTLYIQHEDNSLKYKFIPSKTFENKLKATIQTGQSPLILEAENALKDKILTVYKDLF